MTCVVDFEIVGLPKTINAIGRCHWAIKHKEANKWKRLVFEQCIFHKLTELCLTKATLELTRFSSIEPDFDNLASSFKHVIDGLVKANVLLDDKPSIIGSPTFIWDKAPKGRGKIKVRIFKA